jgi:hypothetical protein
MRFVALVGLLALTACGTYAVRVYDYGHAERGEAPAERGDDSDGKGRDKGEDAEAGEADTGKGSGGKDKGKDGDD